MMVLNDDDDDDDDDNVEKDEKVGWRRNDEEEGEGCVRGRRERWCSSVEEQGTVVDSLCERRRARGS